MAKIRDVRVADPFASAAIVLKCTNCGHVSQYDTRATKKTEKPCPVYIIIYVMCYYNIILIQMEYIILDVK